MSFVSLSQFKELVQRAVDTPYDPKRGRFDHDHPAGELFTGGGDTIQNIRIKFLMEDDGSDWSDSDLVKPQYIWDMKKIASNYLIGDGTLGVNAKIEVKNGLTSEEGLTFLGHSKSYASQTSSSSLTNMGTYTLINVWFQPQLHNGPSLIYGLTNQDSTVSYAALIYIKHPTIANKFILYFAWRSTGGVDQSVALSESIVKYDIEQRYNLLVYIVGGVYKFYLNGELIRTLNHGTSLQIDATGKFHFGLNFKGEIVYFTMQGGTALSDTVLRNYWKFGYPLPRKKEFVDLSDNIESYGKNLLIDAKDIQRVLENVKGQFYVKTNNVKLRS